MLAAGCLVAIIGLVIVVVQRGAVPAFAGLFLALLPVPLYVAIILYLERLEPGSRALFGAGAAGAAVAEVTVLLSSAFSAVIATPELGPHLGRSAGVTAGAEIGGALVAETFNALVLVLLLTRRRGEIDGAREGVIYASMTGLGFALMVNLYGYVAAWESGEAIAGGTVSRWIIGPLFQALFTCTIGLGMARAAARRKGWHSAVAVGWGTAVALDALWNYSAGTGGALLAVTYLLLVGTLVGVVLIVVADRQRVAAMVARFLPAFEHPEVVTGSDIPMLASLRLRRLGRRWARLNFDVDGKRAMMRYQLAATELATVCNRNSLGLISAETFTAQRDDSLALMRAAASVIRNREQLYPPPWIGPGDASVFSAVAWAAHHEPIAAWFSGGKPGGGLQQAVTSTHLPGIGSAGKETPLSSPDGRSEPPAGGGEPRDVHNPEMEPQRYLKGQCPDGVRIGEPFSVLVSIVLDGPVTAPLKVFPVGHGGQDVLLVLHAPGLQVLSGQRRVVHVPPGGDSEPVMFEMKARSSGPCQMSITAWLAGTYLGELAIETTADRYQASGDRHRDFHTSVDAVAAEGAVGLVVRYDPVQNAYRFEFRDEDNPDEVPSQLAYEPGPRVERLVAELDRLAKGRAGFTAIETRDYLREAGVGLWRELLPEQLRRQFWERQKRITQLTILADRDTVPWELLYPLDPGHDAGFLVEQFPVTRMVFRHRPTRSLSLSPAWFVLPDGSPALARDEVSELLRLLHTRPASGPEPVVGGLTPLLELIRGGDFGLLHFACHNAFDPVSGSAISLDKRHFTPTHLNSAAIGRALARTTPTVFINACRSAGSSPTYHQLDGWAGKFIEAGAGAFIGTLWAVRDSTARDFASELYGSLRAGNPLGKAVMQARLAAANEPGDPTWLAYAAYGDPRAAIW